jgi:hypothetical protein
MMDAVAEVSTLKTSFLCSLVEEERVLEDLLLKAEVDRELFLILPEDLELEEELVKTLIVSFLINEL